MAYNSAFSSSPLSNDSQVPLLCPKPRRVGHLLAVRPNSAFYLSSKERMDLYDSLQNEVDAYNSFLTKDSYEVMNQQWEEDDSEMSSSPPFFCGSPPIRTSNPLVRDALFLQEKYSNDTNNTPLITTCTTSPFVPSSPQPSTPSSTTGTRRGTTFFHSTTNFGSMPAAAVRIEGGFDCLDRNNNRNSCCSSSIPAFA